MKEKVKAGVLFVAIVVILSSALGWSWMHSKSEKADKKSKAEQLKKELNAAWMVYNHNKVAEIAESEAVPLGLIEELYAKNNPAHLEDRMDEISSNKELEDLSIEDMDRYCTAEKEEEVRALADRYGVGHRDVVYLENMVVEVCFNWELFYLDFNGYDVADRVEYEAMIRLMGN